jgi:2-polyprenyl-3-methyl-5-hydroxy-6-metoxy-1,4-benzoquinol methylase
MNTKTNQNQAIVQSLGSSNNEIYSKAFELLTQINITGSILDFGSGQGNFLKQLKNFNYSQIAGADLMDRPQDISESIKWIVADLNSRLPQVDETFDVIIAIEVIEHLENPRAVVREWKRLLKPGGTLIFSTPNNESYRALIALVLKGHFVSFLEKDYPAHITALTELDMKRILQESMFSNTDVFYTNYGFVPGLKGLTWGQLSMGILKGKRFSDNVFMVAKK